MFDYNTGVILWYCIQVGIIGVGIMLWLVIKK
jgi:hypothetical protein